MESLNEYQWYWETNRFYNAEELIGSLSLDNTLSAYVDPSAADGGQPSSGASRNIVSERNRRQKLNDRLYALRAIVPHITKMDKASIVKDSISYIQELQEQEERIQGEIAQLEYSRACENQADQTSLCKKNKRTVHEQQHLSSYVSGGAGSSASPPIQVIEIKVSSVVAKTIVASLICSKRTNTIIKLGEALESLKFKIITANITSFSATLTMTVFIKADEKEIDTVKIKIETAIAAVNQGNSMSC